MAISVENRHFSTHPHVFNAPGEGVGTALELVSAQGSEETRMTGLPEAQKSFKIGLAILIQ